MTTIARSVVHVLGALDRGGAEMTSLDLCLRIDPGEIHQTFVTLSGRTGTLAPRFEAAGASVEPIALRPLWRFSARWFSYLRRTRPQTVVSHASLPSGYILLIARLAGVPQRIARFHSEGDLRGESLPRKAIRAVLRFLLRLSATAIQPVSSQIVGFAAGRSKVLRRRTTVIPNGVDLVRFSPDAGPAPRPGRLTVLCAARGSPEKNRRFLVDVAAEVADPQATTFVFAGRGGAADLGLGGVAALPRAELVVLDDTDDIPRLMAGADVLAVPSLVEGLPGVVLEALASGTPVVANDLPGLRALASELVGITTVPLAAGPKAWARALEAAAASGDRALIRASIAQSPYTLDCAVERWRQLLTTVR